MDKKDRVHIFGQHDGKTLAQLYEVSSQTRYSAIMADGHLGYYMPVGGVAAYDNKICPAGVGYDIACGNAAARTNIHISDWTDPGAPFQFGEAIYDSIAFGLGRPNEAKDAPKDHPLFEDDRWDLIPNDSKVVGHGSREELRAVARNQLGTIGSGNHYVDLLVDEEGYVWVGVHFGSRKFGWTIAHNFMKIAAGGEWWEGKAKEKGFLLDLDVPSGEDYFNLMELAGEYAYAGRDWVIEKVLKILGCEGDPTHYVHNNHNYAWKEQHFGEDLIVVRKGATPAWPNQEGFVGGSMGDNAVILKGVNKEDAIEKQRATLFSTVHGAGRVMSRGEAKRTISQEDVDKWLEKVGVVTFGGGLDEAPQAYRRLNEVLKEQGETVETLFTLKPIVVCMA